MSPASFAHEDPDAERAAIAATAARRARIQEYRKISSAQQAQAIGAIGAAYPHLSPGVAVPLGMTGARYDDPMVVAAATAEAKSQHKKRGFIGGIGDFIGNTAGKAINAPLHLLQAGGDIALDVLKPTVRHAATALSAPFEELTGVLGNVASTAGEFVAGVAGGAATGASFGAMGFTPWSVAAGAIGGGLAGGVAGAVGQAKDVVKGKADWRPQSTLGVALTGGGGTGEGYLPGGGAYREAVKRRQAAASVAGHAFTPGRMLAASVFEPESMQYRVLSGAVDFANIMKADPAFLGLSRVSKARAGARGFTESDVGGKSWLGMRGSKELQPLTDEATRIAAGLVDHSYRPTIITNNALNWLTSEKKGQRLVEWLRNQDDFEAIRRNIKGIDPDTALALKEAKTADEVISVLLPRATDTLTPGRDALRTTQKNRLAALIEDPRVPDDAKAAFQSQLDDLAKSDVARGLGYEGGLINKPRIQKGGAWVTQRRLNGSRLWAEMPGTVDMTDTAAAVDNFSNLLRNSNLEYDVLKGHTEAFATALRDGDIPAARRAFFEPFVGEKGILNSLGMDTGVTKRMRKGLLSTMDDIERRAHYERVLGQKVTNIEIAGASHGLPDTGLLADAVKQAIIPIDRTFVRGLRRATATAPGPDIFSKAAQKVYTTKGWDIGVSALDFATANMWKPFTLLRGAYTVRVIAEEQIRMANSGMSSMFSHPLSYLAWAATDDGGRLGNALKKLGIEVNRGDIDLLGRAFSEADPAVELVLRGHANEFAKGIGRKQMLEHWLPDRNLKRADNAVTWNRGDEHFHKALHERLYELHNDPIAVRVAHGDLLPGDVPTFRKYGQAVEHWVTDGAGRQVLRDAEKFAGEVDPHQALERYKHWVADSTGGKHVPERAPVSVGAGVGGPMGPSSVAGDPLLRQAIATGEINGVKITTADGQLNPAFAKELEKITETGAGPFQVTGADYAKPTLGDQWNRGVEAMFSAVMGNRTATLSRSPFFRQYYWKDAANLAAELDSVSQARMLAMLDKAELPASYKEAVRAAAARGTGELTLGQADTMLKGRALDQTRDLLYDVSKRGQLSDVLRIVFPFAEAQKEVLKVWARIGTENLQVARGAQKIVEGARRDGFFYKDPQTGEEMFNFSGSELLVKGITGMFTKGGIKAPLTGQVKGLSMFGHGLMPGVGPVVQLSASWILPDKPEFDDLREMIDPMGSMDSGAGILERFGPSWAKKLATGFAGDKGDAVFANQVKEVWRAGVANGQYSTDTPEEVRDGLEDAKSKARWLFIIRGASQFVGAPTAPSVEMMVADPDGKWHMAGLLAEDYQKFNDDPDIEDADAAFLEKYGDNAFGYMQPLSVTTGVIAGATEEAGDWVRANKDLVRDYPDVYGFLAPQGEEFDSQTYLNQIKSGQRIRLSPEEFALKAKDRQGKLIYYNVKDRFGPYPTKPQREFLTKLRVAIAKEYPGFDQHLSLPEKLRPDEQVEQVVAMAADKRLDGNPIAATLRTYLQARDILNEKAKAAGFADFNQAKALSGFRAFARQLGEALMRENPDFAVVWERILSREMIDDEALNAEAS